MFDWLVIALATAAVILIILGLQRISQLEDARPFDLKNVGRLPIIIFSGILFFLLFEVSFCLNGCHALSRVGVVVFLVGVGIFLETVLKRPLDKVSELEHVPYEDGPWRPYILIAGVVAPLCLLLTNMLFVDFLSKKAEIGLIVSTIIATAVLYYEAS